MNLAEDQLPRSHPHGRRHLAAPAAVGQQVDVVPFGGLERDGQVMVHESILTVIGCAEAAARADHVTLPSGRILPVAPLELIAVLKLMAFADRHPTQTKDADDLLAVLRASSHGVYGDEIDSGDRVAGARRPG